MKKNSLLPSPQALALSVMFLFTACSQDLSDALSAWPRWYENLESGAKSEMRNEYIVYLREVRGERFVWSIGDLEARLLKDQRFWDHLERQGGVISKDAPESPWTEEGWTKKKKPQSKKDTSKTTKKKPSPEDTSPKPSPKEKSAWGVEADPSKKIQYNVTVTNPKDQKQYTLDQISVYGDAMIMIKVDFQVRKGNSWGITRWLLKQGFLSDVNEEDIWDIINNARVSWESGVVTITLK